jgi:hypothetical protein
VRGIGDWFGINKSFVETRFSHQEIELNWIGDFNSKMLGVIRLLGVKKV